MAHSQPAYLYAPKPALRKLSRTLPNTLSSTLPIALDDTLLACLTICSQVSYQDAPKYSLSALQITPPSMFSSTLPIMLSMSLLIALDGILLACLPLCSQVHSQEARHSRSRVTIFFRVCSRVLNPETCWVAEARHQQPGGWWGVADGAWHMVAEIMTPVDIIHHQQP